MAQQAELSPHAERQFNPKTVHLRTCTELRDIASRKMFESNDADWARIAYTYIELYQPDLSGESDFMEVRLAHFHPDRIGPNKNRQQEQAELQTLEDLDLDPRDPNNPARREFLSAISASAWGKYRGVAYRPTDSFPITLIQVHYPDITRTFAIGQNGALIVHTHERETEDGFVAARTTRLYDSGVHDGFNQETMEANAEYEYFKQIAGRLVQFPHYPSART